jgi:hypothetical protein
MRTFEKVPGAVLSPAIARMTCENGIYLRAMVTGHKFIIAQESSFDPA